jgi:hypothetical protein
MHSVRRRYWVAVGLAILASGLLILTLLSKEWIELLFGVDPDRGSGALEWAIVGFTGGVAIISAFAARWEWRRVHPRLT